MRLMSIIGSNGYLLASVMTGHVIGFSSGNASFYVFCFLICISSQHICWLQ